MKKNIEETLKVDHAELEKRVEERTMELEDSNMKLRSEIEERKIAEDALKKAHKYTIDILERIDEGFISINKDWKINYINSEAAKTSGKSAAELIDKNVWDEWPESKNSIIEENYKKAFEEQKTIHFQYYTKESDKWLELNVYPSEDGINVFFNDISGAKKHQQELEKLYIETKQNAAELNAVFESIPDAIYIGDETGIKRANKPALDMLGFNSLKELNERITELSKKINTRFVDTKEKIPPEEEGFALGLKGKKCTREVLVKDVQTNEDKILRSAAAPIKMGNKIIGAVAINSDITESKKLEEERNRLFNLEKKARLEAEQSKIRLSYLDNASIVLSSSLDYSLTLNNLAALLTPVMADWCAIDILENGEIKNVAVSHVDKNKIQWAKELSKKFPPDPNSTTGVYNVIRTGKSEFYSKIPEEVLYKSAKNEEHKKVIQELGFKSAMVVPLKVHENVLGAITFVTSESERYYTEIDLTFAETLANRAAVAIENSLNYSETKKLNEKLEERVLERTEELESFSYSVSHDLRAPLRAIDGFSRLVLETHSNQLDDDGKRYLSLVRKNTQQMGKLIDDLLAFSRIGRQQINKILINMNNLIDEVISEVLNSIPEKRDINFHIDSLPKIKGDQALIKQVWFNLISNAVKFTGKNKVAEIEIGSFKQKKSVEYFVKDNGEGFDMKYADKLFGVFQRLHAAEQFEGTGVGLAIVARIIKKHGGYIKGEGEAGKGAAFYFTLPK